MAKTNTYGILGGANVPKEVINASLNDIAKHAFVIPWYGSKTISPAMEFVYDWMLDNEIDYEVVASSEGRPLPKALSNQALNVTTVEDVDSAVIDLLVGCKPGIALIMWDETNPERSLNLANNTIGHGLESLELTNGLCPIVIDPPLQMDTEQDGEELELSVKTISDEDHLDKVLSLDVTSFDRETLEVMPAASVKRMAANAGYLVKNKEEAIDALTGSTKVKEDIEIGSILLLFNDGTELGFGINKDLLKKIMNLVVDSQSGE
jgi:hypothetical protein